MKAVILSSPILLEEGNFKFYEIEFNEAKKFIKHNDPENFSGHQTTKILGVEPSTERKTCTGYDIALVIQPIGRLEFGREYSVEEIEEIGVNFMIIHKIR